MTYHRMFDPETVNFLAANGGTVTIDKDNPHQRDLWLRLNRLVDADIAVETTNTIEEVSYQLARFEAAA